MDVTGEKIAIDDRKVSLSLLLPSSSSSTLFFSFYLSINQSILYFLDRAFLELYDIRFSRHHQYVVSPMPFAFLSFVFLGNIRRSLLPLKDVSVSFFLECA